MTLSAGFDNYFEHHEYVGLFRYGEIIVHDMKRDAKLEFDLSEWVVNYPWTEEAKFVSSNEILNEVWKLCANTIRYTSLDTFTDSNVRERTPYEADGFVASESFWTLRSDSDWTQHSIQFILNNPTWPTEWKQYSILLVYGQ